MVAKITISVPDELRSRLSRYQGDKKQWEQFNISQVCAEAIDKKLKEEGF